MYALDPCPTNTGLHIFDVQGKEFPQNQKELEHWVKSVPDAICLSIGELGDALTSLEPVGKLRDLEELYATGTCIADISPLLKCTFLEYLELERTLVTSLQALSGLPLRSLHLSDNKGLTDLKTARILHSAQGA